MDSFEGEIIGRISEQYQMMPDEVVDMKYTTNGRFLWMRFAKKLHAEIKQREELEDL